MSQPVAFHHRFDLSLERRAPSTRALAGHQARALAELHRWFDSRREHGGGGLVVMPTGAGKTSTAVRFACEGPLSYGYQVLWLAQQREHLEQAYHAFGGVAGEAGGRELGHIAAPRETLGMRVVSGSPGHFPLHAIDVRDDIVAATLATASQGWDRAHRALHRFVEHAERLLVVFDEAHHAPARTYRRLVDGLRGRVPNLLLLGLTATPTHCDARIRPWLARLFEQGILHQEEVPRLMAEGVLARPRCFDIATEVRPEIDDDALDAWLKTSRDIPEQIVSALARDRQRNQHIVDTYVAKRALFGKTIIFADRWFQCEAIVEGLRARGVRAGAMYSHVDATPAGIEVRRARDRDENARVLAAFRAGELDVIVNVRMLGEGVDVPDVNTVFLTRETRSAIQLTQMVGRALRGPKFGGTEEANIVSFHDDWRRRIAWATAAPLLDGATREDISATTRERTMALVSIAHVRRLARLLAETRAGAAAVSLSGNWMLAGWYLTTTEDAEEGIVLVSPAQQAGYRSLIEAAQPAELDAIRSRPSLDAQRELVTAVRDRHFARDAWIGDMLDDVFRVMRHLAANNAQPPRYFPWESREDHDVDTLARRLVDSNETLRAIDDHLRGEFVRGDRVWRALYGSYDFFKAHVDALMNQALRSAASAAPAPVLVESALPREPPAAVKNAVRRRDGRCVCCGEARPRLLQVDHVVPFYDARCDAPEGLQTICRACNRAKARRTIRFAGAVPRFDMPMTTISAPTSADEVDWGRFVMRIVNLHVEAAIVTAARPIHRGNDIGTWIVRLADTRCLDKLVPLLQLAAWCASEARVAAGLSSVRALAVQDERGAIIARVRPGHRRVAA